jgi:hypothetical protein
MAETTLTQQQMLLDPEIGPYLIGLMESAKLQGTLSKDNVIPEYKFADFTPKQKQAFEMASKGIGSYEQFFDKSGQLYDTAKQQFQQLPQFGSKAIEAISDARSYAEPYMKTAAGKYGAVTDLAAKGVSTTAKGAEQAQPLLKTSAETYSSLPKYTEEALKTTQAGREAAMGKIGEAAKGYSGLTDYANEAQRLAAAGAQGFDPSSVSKYMDPYQQQVIRNSLDEMRRQSDISQQAAAAQAVKAGAFGGSRFGVQQAELARNLAQAQNQKIAELMSQGYTTAQATALTAFEAEQKRKQVEAGTALSAGELSGKGASGIESLAAKEFGMSQAEADRQSAIAQAAKDKAAGIASLAGETADIAKGVGAQQLTAANLEGTAASGIESLAGKEFGMGKDISGTQLAAGELSGKGAQGIASLGEAEQNLGKAKQAAGQADVSFLANIGAQERADQQARLDAERVLELENQNQPWDILNKVSDIYKGVPSGSTTTGSTTAQSPTTASSILGNTMSIYGALSEANKPTTTGYTGYTGYK